MATEIWVTIGSGNGLLPDGTKPLPGPILNYHEFNALPSSREQFNRNFQKYQFDKWVRKLWFIISKLLRSLPRVNEVMACHLFSVKLLPGPEQTLGVTWIPQEEISVRFESNYKYFLWRRSLHLNMSEKCWPFCPGINIFNHIIRQYHQVSNIWHT